MDRIEPIREDIVNRPIPKTLHQIWYQGEHALPDKYRRYHASWRRHHPDWTLRVWDAHTLREHVATHQRWFLPRYDAFAHDIQRIDSARYCVLDTLGGLYADMDIESLRPVDALLDGRELVLSATRGYNNALIGSAPGHPLWHAVHDALRDGATAQLDDLPARMRASAAVQIAATTGPRFFTMCIERSGVAAWPTTLCCPGDYFEPEAASAQAAADAGAYGRHDMDLNWQPPHVRLLSRFTRAVFAAQARMRGARR
ncbi:glycosyltransferase family 32 protein [Burkholderia ubonensis]|uniref:glycosyltransferase family 32 protein n=1 Tax=Burkholderia ubonensis TaxID=101571 RepID=UPI001E436CA5|nr:glycosyltransferase [Burkholderia ubonensis]